MSDSAGVRSIEALNTFRADLALFAEGARHGLEAVEMEIRRASEWLNNEQYLYWRGEVKRRNEAVAAARVELHRRKLMQINSDVANDSDQKEALRIAERRLLEAEQKVANVRKWGPLLQHAIAEYQGQGRPLGDLIGGDLQRALALLGRMVDALDAYTSIAPPPGAGPASTPADATSTAPTGGGQP